MGVPREGEFERKSVFPFDYGLCDSAGQERRKDRGDIRVCFFSFAYIDIIYNIIIII